MSSEEREWLHRAGTAEAVETVVKAGEVRTIVLGKRSEQMLHGHHHVLPFGFLSGALHPFALVPLHREPAST